MSEHDDRPRPKYGEYAPLPPVGAPPADGAPHIAAPPADAGSPADAAPSAAFPPPAAGDKTDPAPRARRAWDLPVTVALLLFGVWDVVTSFGYYADLRGPLDDVYAQLEVGEFTADDLALQVGLIINVARVVILIAVIAVSLLRISQRRTTFWVPLGGGVFAALVLVAGLVVIMSGDPAMATFIQQGTTPTPAP